MTETNENREDSTENKPGKQAITYKLTAIIAAMLLIIGAGVFMYEPQLMASEPEKQASPPAMPPMPVETAEVRVADSAELISAVGSLRSDESVVIAAEIAGRVTKIGFSEGEQVKSNKVLIKLDSNVLQAELDQTIANRDLSQSTYERAENLLKDNAVSKQERDEAYAKYKLDEARVRLASAQLAKTTIIAPFSGTLGLRQVSLGDYIQPGQTLVNLEAIKQLKVEFSIPEKNIATVKVGQKINLTSDAYPGRTFTSSIYAINPMVDPVSRSLIVRGRLNNSSRELLPGQFVKIQLQVANRTDALFIPEQALIPQPNTKLVFTVVDGIAQMVPVETGTRIKGWVEITNGLNIGDIVVTGGHQKIGPGSPVHVIPADPALFAQAD
jgi:membrane fusion protein, multidrug efflux system